MKKLFVIAVSMLLALSASALNPKKVYEAPCKTVDEMLTFGQKQVAQIPDGQFIADMYSKVGVEMPTSSDQQASMGKKISKEKKLEKGDIVFFCSAENKKQIAFSGVVYAINSDDSYQILYMSSRGAILGNSKDPGFKGNFLSGAHIANDKELKSASKEYEKAKNAADKQAAVVEKENKNIEKAQQKIEKAQQDLEKLKSKHEKSLQKANELNEKLK